MVPPHFRNALIVLGASALVYAGAKVLEILVLWSQLALGPMNIKKFKGEWALVTGASCGVGEALAHNVAAHGVNVVMVARSPERLKQAAERVQQAHPGVQTRVIAQDMAADGAAAALAQQLGDLPVSLLLCNVGGGVPTPLRPFWEYTPAEQEYVRRLNGEATYGLVQQLLPGMMQRRRGAVVAVSSFSAKAPAYLVPYGAEKAKLITFIEGLADELHGTGVTAQAAVLGAVYTPGYQAAMSVSNAKGPSAFTPHPDRVARALVRRIGWGATTFIPYAGHSVQNWLLDHLWPPALKRAVRRMASRRYRDVSIANDAKLSKGAGAS